MPPTMRKATPDDTALLLHVIDMASEGVVPAVWDAMAPEGMDASAIGTALVTAEGGDFSYRNGLVLEQDDAALGGMIGYPLPTAPAPEAPEVPEQFIGVKELESLAPGFWYINVVAILPEYRGHGLGAALLEEAEAQAQSAKCPGLALIVAASNDGAIRAYDRAGYHERARRPFDLTGFGRDPTEALLMVKAMS